MTELTVNDTNILENVDEFLQLAETKNIITSRLRVLTKNYQKYFNINISDYTKYPLSYFYFSCQNYEQFINLLPNFFSQHPDIALSFIYNSIYSDITFAIPTKVKVFSSSQIRTIFLIALDEVVLHKDLVIYYIQQFSLEHRNISTITDPYILDFIKKIVKKYKDELIIDFMNSRSNMLSLFSISYPYLTAIDINLMLPVIMINNQGLLSFLKIVDSLSLKGLNTELIIKLQARCCLNQL